jgi:transposase
VTRALELVEAGTHSVEDAAEEVGLGMKTVYRAREASAPAAEEIEPVPATWRPAALPSAVVAAVVTTADPEKARAVRRLVAGMGGTWDGEAVESLAAAWGCALADVQALVIEASIEAGRCALPPELAREEALAVLRWVRDEAKKAADFKSVTAATAEILKIQLAAGEGEGLTKAQFVALARRLLEAVAPYPGAREAAIRVMFPGAGAAGGDG